MHGAMVLFGENATKPLFTLSDSWSSFGLWGIPSDPSSSPDRGPTKLLSLTLSPDGPYFGSGLGLSPDPRQHYYGPSSYSVLALVAATLTLTLTLTSTPTFTCSRSAQVTEQCCSNSHNPSHLSPTCSIWVQLALGRLAAEVHADQRTDMFIASMPPSESSQLAQALTVLWKHSHDHNGDESSSSGSRQQARRPVIDTQTWSTSRPRRSPRAAGDMHDQCDAEMRANYAAGRNAFDSNLSQMLEFRISSMFAMDDADEWWINRGRFRDAARPSASINFSEATISTVTSRVDDDAVSGHWVRLAG
ncbi:hypothetical protein B0H14DRAFT_2630862 [Mycena olivaceomarginata]|nr:hypothetical protein B0H14DRAFT_2630862 [Mycena olivaceomarginata]